MSERLRQWLDSEMKDYEVVFRRFNNRLMKRVPLWMLLSIGGMVALGFAVGYEWTYVLRVHFLIGLGFGLFILLCFWLQTRSVSMKKVRKLYEQALGGLSSSDQEAFAQQASQAGSVDFFNPGSDKYPARLTVGPDFWLYFRGGCQTFRVADMAGLRVKQETTRVGYNVGNSHVRQSLGVGLSLVAHFREGSASAAQSDSASIFLDNAKQLEQARALTEKHCPKARPLWNRET